jgi:TolB-like protein
MGQVTTFAFAGHTLDLVRGRLLRQGEDVDLRPKAMTLLTHLVRNAGRVISKDELVATVWPNVVVSDDSLTQCMKDIRRALGSEAEGLIRTILRRGYVIDEARVEAIHTAGLAEAAIAPPVVPDKPSIAVLPFVNMSTDSEPEYFVDGLTEDLITDLSRNAGLFVIARNSTFAYKGKAFNAQAIARDVGVRYLLEGSARRSSGRVRINVQLIDAIEGGNLWAERFDRRLDDIFAVQDEVAAKIVEALVGRLTALPPRNRPKNLEAYDLCVRARILTEHSPQTSREAYLLLQRAIAIDPDYAEAHRWLALNRLTAWLTWGESMEPNRRMAVATAEKAVELDPNNAGCRWIFAVVLAYENRWAESDEEFSAALKLDPNNADAWAYRSDMSYLSGRVTEGLGQIQRAFRLNPRPANWYYWILGQAQYAARQYESAVVTLRNEDTYRTGSRRILAASLAQLGRLEEARQEAEMFMVSNPHFTISHWASTQPFRDEATRAHFIDGYLKAGLPER